MTVAAGCVFAPDSELVSAKLTVLHAAAASAPSAYATSGMMSETWSDSKQLTAEQPEPSLSAVVGAVFLQMWVLGTMWRQEKEH